MHTHTGGRAGRGEDSCTQRQFAVNSLPSHAYTDEHREGEERTNDGAKRREMEVKVRISKAAERQKGKTEKKGAKRGTKEPEKRQRGGEIKEVT